MYSPKVDQLIDFDRQKIRRPELLKSVYLCFFLIEFNNLKKNSSFKLCFHNAVIVISLVLKTANFVTDVLNLDHTIIVLSDNKKCVGRRKKCKFFPLNMQTLSLFEEIDTTSISS